MSKAKHIPLRRCVICRQSFPQYQLLRLVQKDGLWQFDLRRRAGGRGSWLCQQESCHSLKSLRRFFKQDAEQVLAELMVIKTALENALLTTTDHGVAA